MLRAGTCTATTLDVYIASGFTCDIGSIHATDFQWSSDAIGLPNDHVNLPDTIQVTPVGGPTGISFLFSNLGITSTYPNHVLADSISFNVSALSGTINGAGETLGTHSATGLGTDTAYFQDNSNTFLLTLADPLVTGVPLLLSVYDTVRTTESATFPDVTSLTLFSGTGYVSGDTASSGSIDAYTVSLATTTPASGVPEPGSLTILSAGIAVLSWRLRTRFSK